MSQSYSLLSECYFKALKPLALDIHEHNDIFDRIIFE